MYIQYSRSLADVRPGHLDETVLRDEILNILLAGRDTVRSSLSFATISCSQPDLLFPDNE